MQAALMHSATLYPSPPCVGLLVPPRTSYQDWACGNQLQSHPLNMPMAFTCVTAHHSHTHTQTNTVGTAKQEQSKKGGERKILIATLQSAHFALHTM